jgi:hypothetical protein
MKNGRFKYNDEYATCEATHVTLRIYPKKEGPSEITKKLGLRPSRVQSKGETVENGRSAPIDAWFLSTKGKTNSRDSRRHLDWILKKLSGKEAVFRGLLKNGTKIDLTCYWKSKNGHGGPSQRADQMQRIGKLGIELWYDFYA